MTARHPTRQSPVNSRELVTLAPPALPAIQGEIADMLKEALGPGESVGIFDLPSVKMPTGGSVNWELPSGESTKVIEAVVILRHLVRAYWPGGEGNSLGNPPTCSSNDCQIGIGDPGGDCISCPKAEMGSAVGDNGEPKRGAACKEITRLFLLTEEDPLPVLLALPPTSKKAAFSLVMAAIGLSKRAGVRTQYWDVISKLTVAKAVNAAGQPYGVLEAEVIGPLDAAMRRVVSEYRDKVIDGLRQHPIIEAVVTPTD